MLQILRQYRCRLAGTFGFLLAGAWLGLALAPCVAMAQPAPHVDMPDSVMETDQGCPHCDHAEAPCAEAVTPDCDNPPALASADSERIKPVKLAALPVPPLVSPRLLARPESPPNAADTGPPHPPFTRLHCSFQE
ncbi:MAG TPA: hypothetical protein VF254_03075 [Gammaproteobacteria bacterium]